MKASNIKIARRLVRIARMLVADEGPVLTIVIGMPGSGKSTYAKSMPGASHYEADMFFIDEDGNYRFDRERLRDAHRWCQSMVRRDLMSGRDVVVSNTGLTKWERRIYYEIARECGACIRLKTMTGSYGNIHGVPMETLETMAARYQPVDNGEIGEYGIEIVN